MDKMPEIITSQSQSDTIQRFFRRPFFLSLTIGIPFCIFKLLLGITALRMGAPSNRFLIVSGWLVIVWAVSDILMNIGRSAFDLLQRPAGFEYCTIAQLGRIFRMPLVFLAVDTLISFSIICVMLWSGWITHLSTPEMYLWYFATTMNLISLSLVSVYNEVHAVHSGTP
jgi:hypothetical protein